MPLKSDLQVQLLNWWTHISICLLSIFIWILSRDLKPGMSLVELISLHLPHTLLPQFSRSEFLTSWMALPWTHLPVQQLRCHSWLLSFPHCHNWTMIKSSLNYIINVSIYISTHCWVIAIPNNCWFSFYSWPLWSFVFSVFTVTSINFISNEVTARTVLRHWPLTHWVKIWALFVFYTHIPPPGSVKV